MKKLFSLPESAHPQAFAALQSVLFVFPFSIITLLICIFFAFQQPVWQYIGAVGICIGLNIVCIAAWRLIKKGHHIAAVRLLITSLLVMPCVMAFLLADYVSSIASILIFMTSLLFTIRSLPPADLPRVTFLSLITIGSAILIDLISPETQLSMPFANAVTIIGGVFSVITITFFILREFQNVQLSSKLLLTFLAITIIPFFALGFLLIRLTSQNLKDAAGNNLKTLSTSQAVQIGGLLASEEESLRLLSINPIIHEQLGEINASAHDLESLKQQGTRWSSLPDNDPLVQRIADNPITHQLHHYIETIPNNLEVLVTDLNGIVVADTRRPQHYYVADQEWWQGALDGGDEDVYMSQPIKERPDEAYSIWVSVPIFREDSEEVLGVLRANYSMDSMIGILEQKSVGTGVGADLLLTEGQVYRAEGDIVTFDPETYANLEATADDPYGEFHYDEGIMLVSQSPITTEDEDLAPAVEHLNWRLIHDVLAEEALASITTVTEIGVLSGLGVLLLVTLIALWLSRRISSPILRLTDAAQKISDGDLTAQATVSSTDEIGTLGTTFNTMTSRLRNTLEEVQQQAVALQASTTVLSRQALQLQAASEVSRTVSSELNSEGLVEKVVELVRSRFDLYYVGLFLVDSQHRFAILSAGTGDAGREMLANGYQLEINEESMIGWSINHKEALVSQNTGLDTTHFHRNPLLPNTRSELALPLISQGQVIGAMTLQSEQESAFTPEDVSILQTMADQLANGVEKARLYGQIQQRAIELDRAKTAADAAKEEAEQARAVAEEANHNLAAEIWQTAGQAGLNEKMRGEQDIATLADNVIQQLCKYLEVHSGAVYIVEDKVLRLTGAYAYQRRSFAQEYKIGEDLVGEAAVGKETISNEIPEDYITSHLAQGKILPRFRLIVPVIYNQEVNGVIALESMSEFTQAQKRFVEQVTESVAIAFMTAQARSRVNELLSQTRKQAEELQAQEEELRATNEELEAQAESLRASRNRPNTSQGR